MHKSAVNDDDLVGLFDSGLRVYVIGAGVSASCGIPVTKDIFQKTVEFARRKSGSDARLIEKLVRYLYPDEERFPNLEEFLNQVVIARQFNTEEFVRSEAWNSSKIQSVFLKTLKYTAEYIGHRLRYTSRQVHIRRFVHNAIRPGDVIITFNWDTTIEAALSAHPEVHSVKNRYFGRETSEVVLMKPHGSIDWGHRIEFAEGGPKRKRPRILEDCPLIVPPVSDKQFALPLFKRIWRSIFEAVSDADELYFLGYSLPKEDQFARFVFRRALRENFRRTRQGDKRKPQITVLNKDRNVEETFKQLIGHPFKFLPDKFEQYVEKASKHA